jgi:hypothetical protein
MGLSHFFGSSGDSLPYDPKNEVLFNLHAGSNDLTIYSWLYGQ